jgi:hypothetical protein
MSILNLIKRISQSEKRDKEIVSLIREGQRELLVIENNLIETFLLKKNKEPDNYKKFYIKNGKIDSYENIDPYDPEIVDYVESLPEIRMILARKVNDNNWLAVPKNPAEAVQKGIIGSQIVYNCDNCSYFDHIICGYTTDKSLIFKNFDQDYDISLIEEMRENYLKCREDNKIRDICPSEIKYFRQHSEAINLAFKEILEFIEEKRKKILSTAEGRIRTALKETDAKLRNVIIRGNLADVRWISRRGNVYNSVVNALSLDVISAGLCLSGEDEKYDLISLVDVVSEGERKNLINRW